ncbi:hypothetical protein BRE01_60350 [Brevibacillus reuszeri]|uniref:Uncharacterized protein n=1 Tax=Brevibacillus reuszeri TaxID=54915 RepID=A0A0K9YNC7_9BACL|nr:hypothetical protein ADS79_14720 [Brevibacillus reuszeri]GED72333.1 hypothetical protein BRE01_60350 [Brevibacillus reuszeri]
MLSSLWGEFFGGVNVSKLKEKAYQLKEEMDSINGFFSWFRQTELKSKLVRILDEIDCQEGRLQFANRPYSLPSARIRRCTNDNECQCGCWATKRKEFFKL